MFHFCCDTVEVPQLKTNTDQENMTNVLYEKFYFNFYGVVICLGRDQSSGTQKQ